MISIDFSDKLPFRLKLPMVKAAIKVCSSLLFFSPWFPFFFVFRVLTYCTNFAISDLQRGVYFEISYSGLILDAQLRRQTISNAKVRIRNCYRDVGI